MKEVEFKLKRLHDNGKSSIGFIQRRSVFKCFTLEDEARDVKVKGETRIAAGRYEVKKREVLSGLTKKYREKYPWFDFHLELQNVPSFQYVYIHIGNTDKDTDACILVGNGCSNLATQSITHSADAYKALYQEITGILDTGAKVFIDIENEGAV